MVEKNTDPKGNIIHKESTTGFPKESNFYGDGVPILGYKKRDHLVFKVEQRTYSTKSAAVPFGCGQSAGISERSARQLSLCGG